MGPIDEDEIGIETPDGGTGITCRVSSNGTRNKVQRIFRQQAEPGAAVRVAITFGKPKTAGSSARVLVFIDPITGKGVVRMGMYDTSKSSSGREIGKQVVWETDTPVWTGNVKD